MTLVIGLTGGIASGKSTVTSMIKEKGFQIVDADMISREVVKAGESAYHEIVKQFGPQILKVNKELDREKLGNVIFSDEEKRVQLNQIVHPAVRKEMLKKIHEAKSKNLQAIVLDIPLLFESKLTNLVDKVLVIYVDEKTQLSRLMNRNNLSEQDAKMRIQSQLSIEKKKKMGDYVIDNSGTIQETKEQLNEIIKKLLSE
ncbi:dephospho-CoA kinase [Metabacillus sp. HB246100]